MTRFARLLGRFTPALATEDACANPPACCDGFGRPSKPVTAVQAGHGVEGFTKLMSREVV